MSKEITLLLVDDDPLFRESISAYLEDINFNVIEASNGREGLYLYREQKPDLIICDTHMPIMSGIELLSELISDQSTIPFIIISSANVMHDAVEALRLGACDYILKPLQDMDALELTVNRALERSRLVHENDALMQELKEDQEAAKVVQFQMLPEKKLKINNYQLEYYLMPSLCLSGDFVDYFQIDNNHFIFYIADVSGHGAASAFITVLLKSFMNQLQGLFVNKNDNILLHPTKLLAKLSQEIREANLGKYLTMVYGVVDMNLNQCNYAVGGHFPRPVLSSEKAEFIDGDGYPIGVIENAEYKLFTLDLPDKFVLTLFSDGVLEVLEETTIDEQEARLLKNLSNKKLSKKYLVDLLALESKESLPDDVTFLMLTKK